MPIMLTWYWFTRLPEHLHGVADVRQGAVACQHGPHVAARQETEYPGWL